MQTTSLLFPGRVVAAATCGGGAGVNDNRFAAPRVRRRDRQPTTLEPCCLEDRLPADHPARTVWKAVKAKPRDDQPSKHREPRASTTDADARTMKMGHGGFDPAYNVPMAADTESRAIVAMGVTHHGCDRGEDRALREQIQRRTGQMPHEHLLDGGYLHRHGIEPARQ